MNGDANQGPKVLVKLLEDLQKETIRMTAKIEENRAKMNAILKQIEEREQISNAGDHLPQ